MKHIDLKDGDIEHLKRLQMPGIFSIPLLCVVRLVKAGLILMPEDSAPAHIFLTKKGKRLISK